MPSVHIKVNSSWRSPHSSEGTPALDLLRGELGLSSTKEGCREGDCGACAVLVGERIGGVVRYRAMPSCLLAAGELRGKHLISLEGLVEGVEDGLTPIMRAFLEENASQCGFCTPGFIISLTSWLAESQAPDMAGALRAVDGNLCRCTGYAAIRRAAARLVQQFASLPLEQEARLRALVDAQVLPPSVLRYIEESKDFASNEENSPADVTASIVGGSTSIVGGGTDFYVRNPEPEEGFAPFITRMVPIFSRIRTISEDGTPWLDVGAAVTVSDFFASPEVRGAVPGIERFETMFASTLIRNLATIGGNIVNASPVADITSMLLALRSRLVLSARTLASHGEAHRDRKRRESPPQRIVPIEDFFLGYKRLDLHPDEVLAEIRIPLDQRGCARHFSFEKASKRRNLDIAAVNTAISFRVSNGRFAEVGVSIGGVAPVPMLCRPAIDALEDQICETSDAKSLAALARAVASAASDSVTPIGDVRGSAEYRRRMVHQLMLAHFVRLFENSGIAEELFP